MYKKEFISIPSTLIVSLAALVSVGCSQMTSQQVGSGPYQDDPLEPAVEENDGSTHTHNGVPHTHPLPATGLSHTHNYNRTPASGGVQTQKPVQQPAPVYTPPKPVYTPPAPAPVLKPLPRPQRPVVQPRPVVKPRPVVQPRPVVRKPADPNTHSHNGRTHTHPLPATGVNHQHNTGRAPVRKPVVQRPAPRPYTPPPAPRPAPRPAPAYNTDTTVKYKNYTSGAYSPKPKPTTSYAAAPRPKPKPSYNYDYGGRNPNNRKAVVTHSHNGKSHSHLLPAAGINHKHNLGTNAAVRSTYQQYANGGRTTSSSSSSPYSPASSTSTGGSYQVVKGDTVFQVMRNTGVYWKDIIRLNNLQAPGYTIHPGQTLRLR